MATDNFYTVHLPDGTQVDVDELTDIVMATRYMTAPDPISPDTVPDSPDVPIHAWCPTCEPDYKPLDNCWQVSYCSTHTPAITGAITPHFDDNEWFQGEAGGPANMYACDLIHRPRVDKSLDNTSDLW